MNLGRKKEAVSFADLADQQLRAKLTPPASLLAEMALAREALHATEQALGLREVDLRNYENGVSGPQGQSATALACFRDADGTPFSLPLHIQMDNPSTDTARVVLSFKLNRKRAAIGELLMRSEVVFGPGRRNRRQLASVEIFPNRPGWRQDILAGLAAEAAQARG